MGAEVRFKVVRFLCIGVLLVVSVLAVPSVFATETIFGSTDPSRGGFRGDVYVVPESIERIPNFTHMKPVGTLYARTINVRTQRFDGRLPNATRSEWFAIRYTGTFYAPRDGKYRFRLKSDDGSKLFIDNQLVIDNDGIHSSKDEDETVRLKQGNHFLEVQYFQGKADVNLALYVKPPKSKEIILEALATPPAATGSSVVAAPAPTPVISQTPVQQPVVQVPQTPVPVPSGGSSGQLSGFSVSSNNGNWIGYGAGGELCMQAMQPGGAWAQMPVPYNLNAPYSVSFDYKITETDNHFILIYYDDFVSVHIDWGKQISHYQPGASYQLKQTGFHLNPHQWYRFRIDANPSTQTFTVYVDGQQIGHATGIKPGHRYLKQNPVVANHPDTIVLGNPEPDASYRGGTYDRGSACWRNFSWQGGAGGGGTGQPGSAFGSATVSTTGFKGNIYYLANGTSSLPDFSQMQPVGTIYTPSLNVPPQSFTKGFPGVTNRFEWFGIRYTGSTRINQPGEYTFRVASDDGTKLWIDGQLLINNDGIHPTRSGTGRIYLNPGVHEIQLDYFQGPRTMVALQFFMTPPGGSEAIFDGVFQPGVSGGGTGGFGGSTYQAGALRGDIYFLPNGTRALPDFNQIQPVGSIYTHSLNVPNQSFTKGFPGVTDRFEWFGIRYTGGFQVYQGGEYQFRCVSDDGSKVWIDGQLIINNDGVHPARGVSGKIYLTPGHHSIQVDYFQGPRTMVCLGLYMTPPGGTEQLFQVAQPR